MSASPDSTDHTPDPSEPDSSSISDNNPLYDSITNFDKDSGLLLGPENEIEFRYSFEEMGNREICEAIAKVPVGPSEDDMTKGEVLAAEGQHAALMRLDRPLKLRVQGSLGDYAFAFNRQVISKVFGHVGHGVADGMVSGSVRVRGDAGHGAGSGMAGGTLGIYGSAGDRVGAAMRSGGIFVRGSVGNDVGLGALSGMIVIGGDAGENLGDPLSNVNVYIRGHAASLKQGVTEAKLRKKQEVQLGLLLISAGIRGDASDFRRIVPEAKLAAEKAARGEVVPNWR